MIRKIFSALVLTIIFSPGNAQVTENKEEEKVIFLENFQKDTTGKFPSQWISNTSGEIVTVSSYPGKWLQMHSPGTYIPLINAELPKDFTMEFDFIFRTSNGSYNTTEVTIFDDNDSASFDTPFPGKSGLRINLDDFIVSYTCYNNLKFPEKASGENRISSIRENEKARIVIQVNQQTMHMQVNGKELLTMPEFKLEHLNAIRFNLWGSQAEPLISNLLVYGN